jgi:hypothetical protein
MEWNHAEQLMILGGKKRPTFCIIGQIKAHNSKYCLAHQPVQKRIKAFSPLWPFLRNGSKILKRKEDLLQSLVVHHLASLHTHF